MSARSRFFSDGSVLHLINSHVFLIKMSLKTRRQITPISLTPVSPMICPISPTLKVKFWLVPFRLLIIADKEGIQIGYLGTFCISNDESEIALSVARSQRLGLSHTGRQNKQPAGMYSDWLAVTFRVPVVSQDNSWQNCTGFPLPQDSPSVSSMEVKT